MRLMTDDQYLAWLRLARERIAAGLKLVAWDDTEIGNKDTYCSWGTCSGDVKAYPDPETWDHGERSRPVQGRVSIVRRPGHQWCPFDRRLGKGPGYWGCFYHCRIFGGEPVVLREEAIALIDKAEGLLLTGIVPETTVEPDVAPPGLWARLMGIW